MLPAPSQQQWALKFPEAKPNKILDRQSVHDIFPIRTMKTITYTQARDRFAGLWDETVSTRDPVIIHRRGHEDVALVPADELAGLMETAHLLRSPANAKRLLEAILRSFRGGGEEMTIDELRGKIGIPADH
jgi:antitoxin YefM